MSGGDVEFEAQNERTALAWHRTALSVLAASIILARLTFERTGLAFGSVAAGLVVFIVLLRESRARYQHRVRRRHRPGLRGGASLAALAAAVLLLATTELAALLTLLQ